MKESGLEKAVVVVTTVFMIGVGLLFIMKCIFAEVIDFVNFRRVKEVNMR